MADAPVVHIGENSPEHVAYRLLRDVATAENNAMHPIHSFLIAVAATLAATLTACVPTTTGRDFYNLNVPLEQKAADVDYCDAYAVGRRNMPTVGGLAGVAFLQEQRNALFTTCMMDRGYRKYPLRD